MGLFHRDIGIDLGTANTLVWSHGNIIINEPSVIAVHTETKALLAVGEPAYQMIGRTPANIVAIQPLRDGVVSDFDMCEAMLKHFIRRAIGKRSMFRPRVVVGVPSGATRVEKRAVVDAATRAGAKEVYILEEPLAAAIGAGLPVNEATGHMVLDIGGGTSDCVVISLGGIVASRSIRIAGNRLDQDITLHLRRSANIAIGERTAEEIKKQIGTAYPEENEELEVRGRHLVTGLPVPVIATSAEIRDAMRESVSQIVTAVKQTLEMTPPELASDVMKTGIVMVGGGALLRGLNRLLMQETGLPVRIADDPLTAVARGTGRALSEIETLKKIATQGVA